MRLLTWVALSSLVCFKSVSQQSLDMDTLFKSATARIGEETREEQKTVRNPLAPFDFARPSIVENVRRDRRSWLQRQVRSRVSFRDRWLVTVSVNQAIGLRRGFYNDNLDPLLRSTQTLQPSWERSYAFAPGLSVLTRFGVK